MTGTTPSRAAALLIGICVTLLAICASAPAAAPKPYAPVRASIGTITGPVAVNPLDGNVYAETAPRTITIFAGEAPYEELTSFTATGMRDHNRGIAMLIFDSTGRLYLYGQDAELEEPAVGVYEADGDELAVLPVPGEIARWYADSTNGAIYATDMDALVGVDEPSSLYVIRGVAAIEKTQVSPSGGTSFVVSDPVSGDVFQLVTASNTLRVLDGTTLQPTGDQLDLSAKPLGSSLAVAIDPVARQVFLLQRGSPNPDARVRIFDIADPAAMSELDPVVLPGGSATVQTMVFDGDGNLIVSHEIYEGTDPAVPVLTAISTRDGAASIVQQIFSIGYPDTQIAADGTLLVAGYFPPDAGEISLVPYGRLSLEVEPTADLLDGEDLEVTVRNVPVGQGAYVNFCEDPAAAGQRTQDAGLRCSQEGGGEGFPSGAWVVDEVPDGGPAHDGVTVVEPGEPFTIPAPAGFTGLAGAPVDCTVAAGSCGVFVSRDSRDLADSSLDLFEGVGFDEPEPAKEINGGYVDWGLKESFRTYIKGPIAKGQIAVGGGAKVNPDGTFRFPVSDGVHDPDGVGTDVDLSGGVHFTGHDHGAGPELDLTVSDPRVEIDGQAGTLYADVVSKSLTTGSLESFPDVDLTTLDLNTIDPQADGDTLTWTAIPAQLTANGAPAFAGFYTAGTVLDPLTLRADFGPAQPGTDPEDPGQDPGDDPPVVTDNPPAVAGDASVPPADSPAPLLRKARKTTKPKPNGVAVVASASCPGTAICTLSTPRKVKVKIGGKTYWAKVISPKAVMAGGTAKIKVKLPKAALEALGDGKVTVEVRVVVRAGEQSTARVAKVGIVGAG